MGFSRHRRERFHPAELAQRSWHGVHAERLETVTPDTSLSRPAEADSVAKRREQARPGFRDAAKAPRFSTHMETLKFAKFPENTPTLELKRPKSPGRAEPAPTPAPARPSLFQRAAGT